MPTRKYAKTGSSIYTRSFRTIWRSWPTGTCTVPLYGSSSQDILQITGLTTVSTGLRLKIFCLPLRRGIKVSTGYSVLSELSVHFLQDNVKKPGIKNNSRFLYIYRTKWLCHLCLCMCLSEKKSAGTALGCRTGYSRFRQFMLIFYNFMTLTFSSRLHMPVLNAHTPRR